MTYKEIISKVAEELNLPVELVSKTYKYYWKSIRSHIESLPLKEDISEEEFSKLVHSVNIPSIGKLYVTWDSLCSTKRRFKYLTKIRESNAESKEDKATV